MKRNIKRIEKIYEGRNGIMGSRSVINPDITL